MDTKNVVYKPIRWIYRLCAFLVLTGTVLLVVYQFNEYSFSTQPTTARKIAEEEKVKFVNKTTSFLLESSEVINGELRLTLKNNYHKSINGFFITVGPKEEGEGYNYELLYSEAKDIIPPGESFTCGISYNKLLQINGFILQAVIFSDNSGDGASDFVQEMKDVRQGERVQLKKGLELLKELKPSILENPSELETLKSEVASLKIKDDKESYDYNSGLYYGKGSLIRYIRRIQRNEDQNDLSLEQNLSQLETRLEKFVVTP